MTVEKPDVNKVWASTALPINITDPDIAIPGKTTEGWLGTDIPPHTTFNHEQNRQGQFNKHVNVEGMPVWDADTDYLLNSYSKDPTTGRLYRSLTGTELAPNRGNQPSLSGAEWKELIETELELVVTPTNLAPTSGVQIADTTPTLVSSEYRSLYGLMHIDSEYRVSRTADMTDLVYLSGSLGPVEQHTITTALSLDDTYYWDVRYQDEDGSWSTRSTPTSFIIPLSVVQAPNPQSPTNGALDVTDTVVLVADTFASLPASTHSASQWQISTDPTFTTVDFDSGEDAVNLTSFTQSGISLTTVYYWRVRYRSNTIGFSDWSVVFSFNTVAATVATPTNISPENTASGIGSTVQLTASDFTSVPMGSQTHVASQWQVALDQEFDNIVFDSGEDDFNRESIIATGLQSNITTHYWRVRYRGNITGWSAYSPVTTFTTVKAFADWGTWDGTNDGPLSTEIGVAGNSQNATKADLAPIGGDRFIKVANTGTIEYTVVGVDGLVPSRAARYTPDPFPTGASAASVIPAGPNRAVALYKLGLTFTARVITADGNELTFGDENTITGNVGSSNYFNVAAIDNDNFVAVTQAVPAGGTVIRICTIVDENTITEGPLLSLSTIAQSPNYGNNISVMGDKVVIPRTPTSTEVVFTVCSLDIVTKIVTEDAVSAPVLAATPSVTLDRATLPISWITSNSFICASRDVSNSNFWHLILGTYEEGVGITVEAVSRMPNLITVNGKVLGSIVVLSSQEIIIPHATSSDTDVVAHTYVRVVNNNIFHQRTVDSPLVRSSTSPVYVTEVSEGKLLSATGNAGNLTSYVINGGAV